MEKVILEIRVEEKNGEYVIRVKGEKAEQLVKCFPMCCCRPSHSGDKSKADASCC